jgi:hypothetical protein
VVKKAIAAHGVPQRLLSDNGVALNPSRRGIVGQLVAYVTALGVKAITGKPYKPPLTGQPLDHPWVVLPQVNREPKAARSGHRCRTRPLPAGPAGAAGHRQSVVIPASISRNATTKAPHGTMKEPVHHLPGLTAYGPITAAFSNLAPSVFCSPGFAAATPISNADAVQPVISATVLPLFFISGIIIPSPNAGRIANELGIARKVTSPVKESSNQPKPAHIPQQR